MVHARQAYYSDYITDASGHAIADAVVSLYPAELFDLGIHPLDPPTVAPTATTTTDAQGQFSFSGVEPNDYHIFVRYTPAGSTLQSQWRYNIAIASYEETRRNSIRNLTTSVPRTLSKLMNGLPVTIVCVGDGTTVGYNATGTVSGGWVARLAKNLADANPSATVVRYDPVNYASTLDAPIQSWTSTAVHSGESSQNAQRITVVNAGVTGDTALRVLRRFSNLTSATWFPSPDCYVVQLGAGEMSADPTRAASVSDFGAHLAGLVNALQKDGSEVVLCTPHLGATDAGAYAASVRGVAASLGSGLISLHELWQDHYDPSAPNDGFGTWLDTTTGDHTSPTDSGHEAIGDEIYRIFDGARATPIRGLLSKDREWEHVRLLNNNSHITFVGAWREEKDFALSTLVASAHEMRASTPGDHFTVNVRGSDIYMLCRRWHDGGQVTVTVDGANIGIVDLYCGAPSSTTDIADDNAAMVPQDRIPIALGLSDTIHTITVQLASTINPLAQGTVWRFDALDIVRLRKGGLAIEGTEPLQRMQHGTVAIALNGTASASAAITFPTPFSAAPIVLAQSPHADYYSVVSEVSSTGAAITLVQAMHSTVTDIQTISWLAFG